MHIAPGHMSFRGGVNSILEVCCTSKTIETSNVGSLEWSTCEEVETKATLSGGSYLKVKGD